MPSWIRKTREPSVPQELMLPVRYLRFCPKCDDFKPQQTIVDGQDRILKCDACGTQERFVLSHGVLIPEGTLTFMKAFVRMRAKEIVRRLHKEKLEAEAEKR